MARDMKASSRMARSMERACIPRPNSDRARSHRPRAPTCHSHSQYLCHMTRIPAAHSDEPLSPSERRKVLRFFHFYGDAARGATHAKAGAGPLRRSLAPDRETTLGVPNRIRTGVTAVKGRCPRPLDDGDLKDSTTAGGRSGGGKRDRTADLLHAMQALSQLSYTPTQGRKLYQAERCV